MSLRPMLYAVPSTEPLRQAVGGYDRSIVDRVEAWFQQDIGEAEAEEIELVRHIAEQYVQGKLIGEMETEDHVRVVGVMAETLGLTAAQHAIADGYWAHAAWAGYFDEVSSDLPEEARGVYEWLLNGRPLLGNVMENGGAYYAWLSREEIGVLLRGLQAVEVERPEAMEEKLVGGFHRQLIGWLGKAWAREGELWVFAT